MARNVAPVTGRWEIIYIFNNILLRQQFTTYDILEAQGVRELVEQ